jgi:hypothetical protein
MVEFIRGTRDLAGRRAQGGPYVRGDDLDRLGLARRNLVMLLGQGTPPSVIIGMLGKTLHLCPICAREFEPQRRKRTCSRACANSLTGRANLGRKKAPMSAEHKQAISIANKRYAAEVAAKKIPRSQ